MSRPLFSPLDKGRKHLKTRSLDGEMTPQAASSYTAYFCSHWVWRLELRGSSRYADCTSVTVGDRLAHKHAQETSYEDVSDFIFKHLNEWRIGAAMPGRSSVARPE